MFDALTKRPWCNALVAAAAVAVCAVPLCGARDDDPTREAELVALLETLREKHNLPALAAAVVIDGEIRALGATGLRRRGGDNAINAEDPFHIGSCTKAMTATLLGMLVDDGKLAWGTTVGEVFNDLQMRQAWSNVTLEQLLHHRGGAPANLHADGLWGRLWQFDGPPREARMEMVKAVVQREPGERGRYVYSNAGYAIAGAMAERVMDTPWEQLMQQRLFEPLGMTTAGFGAPGAPGSPGIPGAPGNGEDAVGVPWGHTEAGKAVQPGPGADNPGAIAPGGAVHCSLRDWARFISLHTADDARGLMSQETLQKLHTPASGEGQPYAMGWIVLERTWAKAEGGRGIALTHAGSNTMWYAVAWLSPEKDVAVLVATNQGGDNAPRACDEAASSLIRRFLSGG